MKKDILAYKVLCSVLAIGLGGLALPLTAQANSGLSDEPKYMIGYGEYCYIGSNGANDNVVIIDSDLDKGVSGGYVEKGSVTENSVSISYSTVYGSAFGGYTREGNVKDNSVSISGGTVGYYEEGIFSMNAFGGYTSNGNATGNTVSVNGSTVYGSAFGGYTSNGNATGNTVSINDSTVYGFVQGGYTSNGNAEDNEVSISGGTVYGVVYGGEALNSDVTGNSVSISDSTVYGSAYGGYAGTGNVIRNSVVISGGTVRGDVYGGYVFANYPGASGDATGNSITLSGAADVSQAELYGGHVMGSGAVSDNKLIIDGWSGTVKSLNNFNGDEGGIEVQALAGGLDLAAGKTTDFVFTENGIINCNNFKEAENIQAGVALTVSGDIVDNNGNLAIKATSIRVNDQTAITMESRAAAAAFVNQGAEAVSDSISSLQGAEAGVSAFATISGNNSKYDTGSYVDINGWNGIVGVANTKDLDAGKFSYGAFFENGSGNYNTCNEFNGASFRGDGNTVYNGGGLLMRYEQDSGVYTEASLRAGTAKNEVSNVLSDIYNNLYGYKTENAYYGAHIGIGKIFKLDNGKAWDVYGKYFHTHHEGDSVKIAGDVFEFDSVDSDKLRIGARFSEQQGAKLASYYGLAWEYEFSGDAGGTANHHAMYTPSLEGSTVIGEVGFRYTPDKASPWYFDANIKGYVGMQEGISGSVQAVYSF